MTRETIEQRLARFEAERAGLIEEASKMPAYLQATKDRWADLPRLDRIIAGYKSKIAAAAQKCR